MDPSVRNPLAFYFGSRVNICVCETMTATVKHGMCEDGFPVVQTEMSEGRVSTWGPGAMGN